MSTQHTNNLEHEMCVQMLEIEVHDGLLGRPPFFSGDMPQAIAWHSIAQGHVTETRDDLRSGSEAPHKGTFSVVQGTMRRLHKSLQTSLTFRESPASL